MVVLTFTTDFRTPLPPYRPLSPSPSSSASWPPVEAPEEMIARPISPLLRCTSTSTVGLPRESRTSRAIISSINVLIVAPFACDIDTGSTDHHAEFVVEAGEVEVLIEQCRKPFDLR